MKIDIESWSSRNLNIDFVTLESPMNGTTYMSIGLYSEENRVVIIFVHLEDGSNMFKFTNEFGDDAIIEEFSSFELAEQFFNKMKNPFKLSKFVKDKLKSKE